MRPVTAQAGSLLFPLLGLTILLGGYLGLQQINAGQRTAQERLQNRLQLAKEALIARAVTDANRPGSLPCPDLITDDNGLSNHPNDGKSDLLKGNDCPSYIGWLPWVTLDLPELTDQSGTRFWYVLSPALRDDEQAQPINSNTPASLSLDNRNDIAALIIAPGAAINGQTRPSNRPADYLEEENALGGNHFKSGPGSEQFNDNVLAISRQELMAAVEKRVANEVQRCLEQHATNSANIRHTYPWPSPLMASNGRGHAGSLFGQVPQTQPTEGAHAELAKNDQMLREARQRLGTTTPAELMNVLTSANEQLSFSLTLYDRIYRRTSDLALNAKSTKNQLFDLDKTLVSASSNGKISATERAKILADSGHVSDQLIALREQLKDLGIDVFPDELKLRKDQLDTYLQQMSSYPDKSALILLAGGISGLQTLFSHSQTQNIDIAQSLNNALASSLEAISATQTAMADTTDAVKYSNALAMSRALQVASEQLQNKIVINRMGLHPAEIIALTDAMMLTLASLSPAGDSESMAGLRQFLAETDSLIRSISSQSSSLLPRINTSLNAINSALHAGDTNNWPLFLDATHEAISTTGLLVDAMLSNGDNLTLESVRYPIGIFASQTSTFNSVVTPNQADMVPYADNIRLTASTLQFWAETIERQAGHIALQARQAPEAGNTQFNPDSAFALAEQTLNSINKSSGSLKKLQDWLNEPNDSRKQAAASLALNDTLNQFDKLLQSTAILGQILHGNEADAFPTLWHGSHCAFLQPASGTSSWWQDNHWSETIFYQISQGVRSNEGRLTVNGQGKYHSVVISAGQALGKQNRLSRQSSNFFESSNADSSRDGHGTAPRPDFISRPGNNDFNDRLAY